ncbi:RanBP2-type domain-containing protein [Forsythia ovata]|uniref:RanBP2-type domain-containing protein n=1 Tax=Forsythia ovata TaxID=205694 RepID=A0ABD1PHQ6_9LAMI
MDRGRRRGGMIPLLALHALSEYWRLDRKPPVTAGLIAANTLIYLRPGYLDRILPTLNEVWFNPHLILKHKDLKRFILSAFYHIGDSHLVYNMLSLLWKGIQLESSMGSVEYTSMIATLVGMSQGITLLLAKSLLLFNYERAYYNEYAVGFSGVLFAMKVVLYSQSDNYTYVHGIMVPSRYAAWAELILIQMFVPGVSFLGHLGGILAGLLYLQLRSSYSGPHPFTRIIRGLTSILRWPLQSLLGMFRFTRRRIYGGGTVGGSRPRHISGVWRCQACTFDNSDWFSVCEMCGTHRDGGLSSVDALSRSNDLTLDELRQRRVQSGFSKLPCVLFQLVMKVEHKLLSSNLKSFFWGQEPVKEFRVLACLTDPIKKCPVCSKAVEPGNKNRRLNTSLLIRVPRPSGNCNILIDAGKFFYHSALKWFPTYGIRTIDAVIITHSHADAIGGLDDLRDWTNNVQPHVPIYTAERDFEVMKKTHYYLVDTSSIIPGAAVSDLQFNIIHEKPFIVH